MVVAPMHAYNVLPPLLSLLLWQLLAPTTRPFPFPVLALASSPSLPTDGERHRVLILGGGTAGVGTAAQLKNAGVEDICIVEPSEAHYYQVGMGWK